MGDDALALNGDLTIRAAMHGADMDWQPSPSPSVERKRLHRVGPPEAGQVTSIVRYAPDSTFPAHDHPEGEEILVLEGTFSDEHGDWPAGTYLLNPEGFHHAPFSKAGCVLFVKLRQYAGESRHHVAVRTGDLPWLASDIDGVEIRSLYAEPAHPDATRLERWGAGVAPGTRRYPGGAEIFVIDGVLEDERGRYERSSWLRLPEGAEHRPRSSAGCELYVKTGGLGSLRSSAPR
ncbi:MAG: cupin domain-containing protein [Myxococcota bacterium]